MQHERQHNVQVEKVVDMPQADGEEREGEFNKGSLKFDAFKLEREGKCL